MCEYCKEKNNNKMEIMGKSIKSKELKQTAGYNNTDNDMKANLDLFIIKNEADDKAALMIDSYWGCRYIDIKFCPFCGRKLND